jgi:hypothetical protein
LKGVEIMNRKTANGIRILFLVIFLFVSVSGCMMSTGVSVSSGPPPWGHGSYHYRYYPYDDIYFDEQRGVYFYLYDGGWQTSVSLPAYIQITVNDFVTLDMDTDKPYKYHSDVVKRYPPGQQKKRDQDTERNKSRGINRPQSQEKEQPKVQGIDRNKSEDKNQNRSQGIDGTRSQEKEQPKAQDRDKNNSQDKDKAKAGARDKNKSKDKDEATDKDQDKNQDKTEDNN